MGICNTMWLEPWKVNNKAIPVEILQKIKFIP